nr:retrovirus-related Pol polyprotein from transposon TNT 1-94 [Tanacetum cinerariifolium]
MTNTTVGIGVGPVVRPQPVPTGKPKVKPVPTGKPTVTPVPTGKPKVTPVPTGRPKVKPVPTGKPKVSPAPTSRPNRPFSVPTDRGYTLSETPVSATKDGGIFDSGCSRSMTGNKERLDDFHAFHGGKVTFGGGEGRITGKGTIRKQHKASYKTINAVSSISEPLQLLHMDLFGPTSIRSIDHKYYCLVITDDYSRVSVISPHNKTPYALLTGNIPSVSHFKPFGCHVTILNTSDHLGKFDGKADEGYIVGYSVSNKAYRVYNVPNKRVEESMNLWFLKDKPNVQGLVHEWYFDLDYLTDSLVIIVPSDPSHNIQGTHPIDTPGEEHRDTSYADSPTLGTEHNAEDLHTPLIPTGSIPVPATATMVPFDDVLVHSSSSTDSIFDGEPTTRFPCPFDLGNHNPSPGIFSFSSYDDEFDTDLNNVASFVEVNMLLGLSGYSKTSEMLGGLLSVTRLDLFLKDIDRRRMDVKSAFLYGRIEKEVYVTQPKYFVDPQHPKKCYGGTYLLPRTATTPYEAPKPKSKNESDSPVNVHLYRSMIESLLVLEAYKDSDYAGANKDRKSRTGGCQFLGRRLMSWQCKKQTIVATSSSKADAGVPSGIARVPTGSVVYPTGGGAEVAEQAVPHHMPSPDHSLAYLPTPTRPPTSDPVASVLKHDHHSDQHETATVSFPSRDDAPLGGNFHPSPSRSSHAPTVSQPSRGEEDLITLTALSFVVSTLIQKVRSLEAELLDHKKLFKDVVGKLVKKVKTLEVKLKTKKRKMVVSDSDQEDGTTQNVDLDALRALVNVAVAADSSIPSGNTSQFLAASPCAPPAGPIGTSKVPPTPFAIPSGAANCASNVSAAALAVPGKSPMVEEDIPVKARTFRQMEEDRLGEEAARRIHEEEMAEMEREGSEAHRKRQQKVLESTKFYNEADWLNIRAREEANASLSKTLLGDDVTEDNFPAHSQGSIKSKIQAFSQNLKRPGPVLEEPSTKRPKSPEAPTSSMPELSISLAVTSPPSSRTSESLLADSNDEDSVDEVWSSIVGWELLSTPLGEINALYRIDGTTKHFATFCQILYMVDRQDLMKLYGLVVQYYKHHPAIGAGLLFWGDLQVLFDSQAGGKGYSNSPMIQVLRVGLVINPPGYIVPTGRVIVPTGGYVVPTGRVIVATGRHVVPA